METFCATRFAANHALSEVRNLENLSSITKAVHGKVCPQISVGAPGGSFIGGEEKKRRFTG